MPTTRPRVNSELWQRIKKLSEETGAPTINEGLTLIINDYENAKDELEDSKEAFIEQYAWSQFLSSGLALSVGINIIVVACLSIEMGWFL